MFMSVILIAATAWVPNAGHHATAAENTMIAGARPASQARFDSLRQRICDDSADANHCAVSKEMQAELAAAIARSDQNLPLPESLAPIPEDVKLQLAAAIAEISGRPTIIE